MTGNFVAEVGTQLQPLLQVMMMIDRTLLQIGGLMIAYLSGLLSSDAVPQNFPVYLCIHVQILAREPRRSWSSSPPSLLVLDEVYGPDLPDEEVSAAVGADILAVHWAYGSGDAAARAFRTQSACRLAMAVQQRILLDVTFRLRPQSLPAPAFFDALCNIQVGCCVSIRQEAI